MVSSSRCSSPPSFLVWRSPLSRAIVSWQRWTVRKTVCPRRPSASSTSTRTTLSRPCLWATTSPSSSMASSSHVSSTPRCSSHSATAYASPSIPSSPQLSSSSQVSSFRRPSSRTRPTRCSPSLPSRPGSVTSSSIPSPVWQPSSPKDSSDWWASV